MTSERPPLHVIVDTREQLEPLFPAGVTWERCKLGEGDYSTPALLGIAAIERKSPGDFAASITRGRARLDREVERLLRYRWKCVVVEGSLADVLRASRVHLHGVLGTVASYFARHDLPTFFASDRASAGRLVAGLLSRWEDRRFEEG